MKNTLFPVLQGMVLVLLLTAAPTASADWFYRLVGYTCDDAKDQLVVYYVGAYNEKGVAMREAEGPNAWDPSEFIASMKEYDHIGQLRTIDRTCKLKHGSYQIRFGATPGNYNIQGRCGAVVAAWVEVRRENKIVLPRYELGGDCQDMAAPVTTQIVFTVDEVKPSFAKRLPEEFLR